MASPRAHLTLLDLALTSVGALFLAGVVTRPARLEQAAGVVAEHLELSEALAVYGDHFGPLADLTGEAWLEPLMTAGLLERAPELGTHRLAPQAHLGFGCGAVGQTVVLSTDGAGIERTTLVTLD